MRSEAQSTPGVVASIFSEFFRLPEETKPAWQKNSRCAAIYGIRWRDKDWVVKIPGMGEVWRLSPEQFRDEGAFINRATEAYKSALKDRLVPFPEPYEMATFHEVPVHFMPYEGDDCAVILKRDPARLVEVLSAVLAALHGLLQPDNRMVGIDARLSNFAFPEGKARCVDLFPPLVHFEGKYLVHYPNPTDPTEIEREYGRKYTPFGILRRLRFDVLSRNPEWELVFLRAIEEFLESSLRTDITAQIMELPDRMVGGMSRRERVRLLEKLEPWEADARREIAARLLPMDEHRETRMKAVFAATSFVQATHDDRAGRLREYHEIIDPFL